MDGWSFRDLRPLFKKVHPRVDWSGDDD